MRVWFVLAAVAAAAVQLVQPAAAREHMWIVAPSVSLPFTRAVAERTAKAAGAPAPVIDQAETLGRPPRSSAALRRLNARMRSAPRGA